MTVTVLLKHNYSVLMTEMVLMSVISGLERQTLLSTSFNIAR